MKAQAESGEMDRKWAAWITLPRRTKALHTPIAQRSELLVLTVQRALKGAQLEPSTPKLAERQARLRESQSLDLVHWGKMLQAWFTLVRSRE